MIDWSGRPAILDRLTAGRPALIEASAGTGKTYTLEHLVVELILARGARIEEILVVTFTEKATAELTLRVRKKLDALLREPLDEASHQRLRTARSSFDSANISTIHGFCQKVLAEHAFQNRRLFSEAKVDGRASFSEAFREVLRRRLTIEPEPRALLDAWLSVYPLTRLEDQLWKCHTAHAELRPGFDPSLLEWARAHFEPPGMDACIAASKIGGGRSATTVRKRLLELAALCRRHRGADLLARLEEHERKPGLFKYLYKHLLAAKDDVLAQAVLALDQAAPPLLAAAAQLFLPPIVEQLGERKRGQGQFDFDDMLRLVEAALEGSSGEALRTVLRARFRYALIDEFQDTDSVQWRIFERLFLDDSGDRERGLYLIGDPKQAIYRFRGADVRTYADARARLAAGNGLVEPLTECFRATEAMIGAYNQIFDAGVLDPFFTGDIGYPAPVSCGRPTLSAIDARGEPVAPITLWELSAGSGTQLRVRQARKRLAAAIADEITALTGGALRFGERGREEKIEHRDVFVLTRTLAEGDEIGRALRQAGVPHAFYKQTGLFQSEEAYHVLYLLQALEDPHARAHRNAAFATPFFGLTLPEMLGCDELPAGHPLHQRLFEWRAIADAQQWERLSSRILADSGLTRRLLFAGRGERALTNYQHLFELLLEHAARARPTLHELTATLAGWIAERAQPDREDPNVQRLESERDAVQIMTMHKAKGLEAKVVFIYGGLSNSGSGPLYQYHEGAQRVAWVGKLRHEAIIEAAAKEDQEEDHRLLYVAITRAQAKLYLPHFNSVKISMPQALYRHLQRHLTRVSALPGFEVRRLSPLDEPRAQPGRVQQATSLAGWRPDPLFAPPSDESHYARLIESHAAPIVTSYTRMKADASRRQDALDVDEFAGEDRGEPQPVADGDLPPGAETGIFLHDLLERLELEPLAGAPPLAEWRERPEVRALFEQALATHRVDPPHLPAAERLCHAALTARLPLPDGSAIAGLAGAERTLREVEFLYPWGRDFIQGFFDLVFEHRGRVYFLDWKSDLLDDYAPESLRRAVDEGYRLQAQLYTFALCKLFGISDAGSFETRFGGVLYAFVRAMRPGDSAGVHVERPSFAEVTRWQAELLAP